MTYVLGVLGTLFLLNKAKGQDIVSGSCLSSCTETDKNKVQKKTLLTLHSRHPSHDNESWVNSFPDCCE